MTVLIAMPVSFRKVSKNCNALADGWCGQMRAFQATKGRKDLKMAVSGPAMSSIAAFVQSNTQSGYMEE